MLHYACTSTLVTCYIGLLPVDDCVTFPQVIDTRDELVKALVGRHNVHLYVRMSVIPSPSVFFSARTCSNWLSIHQSVVLVIVRLIR